MDEGDAELEQSISHVLAEEARVRGISYHQLRYRNTGTSVWVEVHLLFPTNVSLKAAHAQASDLEAAMLKKLPLSLKIITHLEPVKEHDQTHKRFDSPHP